MKTYTFLQEHYSSIINHTLALSNTIHSMTLTNGVYTLICDTFDEEEYLHLHEHYGLTEVN